MSAGGSPNALTDIAPPSAPNVDGFLKNATNGAEYVVSGLDEVVNWARKGSPLANDVA